MKHKQVLESNTVLLIILLYYNHSLTQKYLSKKRGRIYFLFIDFEKAFDYVNHDRLWDSLQRRGISGQILKIFKSMYQQLSFNVRLSGYFSKAITCKRGTR